MAPQKSPAFQFYAKDFLAGTASMSLLERGAYVTLLAYEWDAGSVPDSPRDRARILGCTAAQEKSVWSALVKKFILKGDAYINERLEEERVKQAEYRRRQSDKGKASAAARTLTTIVTPVGTPVQPSHKPEGQPEVNSADCSLQSSSSIAKETKQQHAAPLIKSPAYVERRRQFCAFVGSKIEVPNGLHAELRTNLGGADPEHALQDWYLALNEQAEAEAWRIPVDKDFFPWFKALYAKRFPVTLNGAKSIDEQIDEWARS